MNLDYLSNVKEVNNNYGEVLKNYDKVFFNTIVKRQYLVLKDLFVLHDLYPQTVSADLVGSLDSLFRLLSDVCDSAINKPNR